MKYSPSDEVIAYETDDALRKAIGEDIPLDSLFSEDRIAACQKLIDDARAAFFDSALPELRKLEKGVAQGALALTPLGIRQLVKPASLIKSQANAFGLPFVSRVSAALVECCEGEGSDSLKSRQLMLKLVDALKLAFDKKMLDDGGKPGRAVLESLRLVK